MIRDNKRWLDQTGLNLIRIVIGSYFMAASLDLVNGLDQRALFSSFLPYIWADLIGSTLLFSISACFMTGIHLRLTSLTLALFVLSSSSIQIFFQSDPGDISSFWRDITLACAVLLNYSTLSHRDIRRAALFKRRPRKIRKPVVDGDTVVPRRVSFAPTGKHPNQTKVRPAMLRQPAVATVTAPAGQAGDNDPCENMFATAFKA